MKKTYIKPNLEVYIIANTRSICSVSGGSAAGSGIGEGTESLVKEHYIESEEESARHDFNIWQ